MSGDQASAAMSTTITSDMRRSITKTSRSFARLAITKGSAGVANDKTNIGWCDVTWNPVTGCSKVSAGCEHCYAARQAPRLAAMGQKGYTALPWTAKNASENVMTHPDRLAKPLHWRKPRRVFVNSMSDLFHPQVPFEFIGAVFGVMAAAPQHTFQALTKRPGRAAKFFRWVEEKWPELFSMGPPQDPLDANAVLRFVPLEVADVSGDGFAPDWPLPNVHLGVSVENQDAAWRVRELRKLPAAVRFLSCEPLIGPLELIGDVENPGPAVSLEGWSYPTDYGTGVEYDATLQPEIDWVIAGGESGPGFRPMDLDWARSLRDQCRAAGVTFFFKQMSGLRPEQNALLDGEEWRQFPGQEVKHG